MSKEQREQIKVCMNEPVLDMGLSRLADHAVLMRKDLRALWAREKRLEAVVTAVKADGCTWGARVDLALEALASHDHDKENPR